MKKRTKIIGGIIGGIIVLGAVANMGEDSSTKQTSATPATQQAAPAPKQETKKITLADYDSIVVGDVLTGEGGSTYDELVQKFGEPSTKSESQSGQFGMLIASWTKNIQGDFGANFNVTFIVKDGQKRASAKSNFGMK